MFIMSPGRSRLFAAILLTAVCTAVSSVFAQAPASPETPKKEDVVVLDKFVANESGIGAAPPSQSAFGFDKSLIETPRAVSIIPDAQLQQFNITKSEDMVKVAPSTYSNFRFGLQGTVTIRNQSSDFFFNGMRRLDPQGIFESVWGAYDNLQIVEGQASPIFGLGRLGGYINFIPKSARAENSHYLTDDITSFSVQYGSFNTIIAKFDYQTPLKLFNKQGGLSVFIEDKNSDGYKANGFSKQKLFQVGYAADLTQNLRMEAGVSYQLSNGGLPGGNNRTIASDGGLYINTKTYWSGNFSYQVDENGDGKIDEKERRDAYFWGTPQQVVKIPATPTTVAPTGYSFVSGAGSGTVSLTNGVPSATAPAVFRPNLWFAGGPNDGWDRTIPWQGGPIARGAGTWTQDGGLTQHTGSITMSQYLKGYTDAAAPALVGKAPVQRLGFQMMFNPTQSDNYASYIPTGPNATKSGQVPYTGIKYPFWVPPTWVLNPSSFVEKPWNKRMSMGEDYYLAQVAAYYFNVIHDSNPDRTIKNQVFVDTNNQSKSGSNAYSQVQHPTSFEDKVTILRKYEPKSWWKVQMLASANYWQCWSKLAQNTGISDIDMRRDLQRSGADLNTDSTFTSNDKWYGMVESSSYVNGLPVSGNQQANYSVTGAGVLFDQTFFGKLNITGGGRYDYVDVHAYLPPGTMDLGSTSSLSSFYTGGPPTYIAGTGDYIPFAQSAKGNASGGSWSVSLSYNAPYGAHPYITYGQQTTLLNGTGSGVWAPQSVKNSILGQSILFETGIKGTLGPKASYSFAYYNQYRAAFQPLTTTAGGASNTISRGEQAKLTYQPIKPLTLTLAGVWSLQRNLQGGTATEPASAFGVPNVVDDTGKVVIPADAWAWGGRINAVTIPDSEPRFRRAAGIPAAIITTSASYNLPGGYFVGASFFYQSAMSLDRLDTMWVPKGHTIDLNGGYHGKKWDFLLNVTNVFDNNIYNFAGFATWVDPKFQRAYAVTLTHHF